MKLLSNLRYRQKLIETGEEVGKAKCLKFRASLQTITDEINSLLDTENNLLETESEDTKWIDKEKKELIESLDNEAHSTGVKEESMATPGELLSANDVHFISYKDIHESTGGGVSELDRAKVQRRKTISHDQDMDICRVDNVGDSTTAQHQPRYSLSPNTKLSPFKQVSANKSHIPDHSDNVVPKDPVSIDFHLSKQNSLSRTSKDHQLTKNGLSHNSLSPKHDYSEKLNPNRDIHADRDASDQLARLSLSPCYGNSENRYSIDRVEAGVHRQARDTSVSHGKVNNNSENRYTIDRVEAGVHRQARDTSVLHGKVNNSSENRYTIDKVDAGALRQARDTSVSQCIVRSNSSDSNTSGDSNDGVQVADSGVESDMNAVGGDTGTRKVCITWSIYSHTEFVFIYRKVLF